MVPFSSAPAAASTSPRNPCAPARPAASARYQSSSCRRRIAANASNTSGVRTRSASEATTRCPAPKQSYAAQPGKPDARSDAWIEQRSSGRRFGQGTPAGLSIAKSADAVKDGATQHRAMQPSQSARRLSRSSDIVMARV